MFRPVYTLHRRQQLSVDLRQVFAFFERPENLPRITPPWLDFAILTPPPIAMKQGVAIDYTVRVLGLPTHWRSLISEYDPPHGFRDVQVIGPYRLWDHRHRFWSEGSGTLVEDFVVYELPLGPLGPVLDRALIRRRLREIFDYRRDRIEALLAPPGGATAG